MTIQGVYLLTVCIWLLNLFVSGNSIGSKSLSTNSDLRSSYQIGKNTEDKREAVLDLAAKLQTTESTLQPSISTTAAPCNCRKYCPAANSTELEVSYRRLFLILICNVVWSVKIAAICLTEERFYQILKLKHFTPVADPGLQIGEGGGGGRSSRPWGKGRGPVRVSARSLI